MFPGGSTLYIESTKTRALDPEAPKDAQGSLQLTGQLGDVMKESAQIAYTFAKSFLSDNDFLQKAHLHVHVPEVRQSLVLALGVARKYLLKEGLRFFLFT